MGPHLAQGATAPAAGALTMSTPAPDPSPSRRGLSLSTAASYVAVGTGVSRVTGLLRVVALAWALGQTHLADSFNLANTTPNMLYDIVLGGVLSATFIPVFVDHLANRNEEEAFESISAVITLSVVVLLSTTVLALILAPSFITALTALDTHAHAHDIGQVTAERAVATSLLRWFVIQIAAYGIFALATALLNTRRRFVAVAWAPIINNVVCIGVLIWFGVLTGRSADLGSVQEHHAQLVLLGLGTSLGVVLQGVALLPSLRAAKLRLLLALEPAGRRVAHGGAAQRVDLRLRAGQPDLPVRGHHPGRHRLGPRPGFVLHLRLRLPADALRHCGGDHHVGGHPRSGGEVVHRADGGVRHPAGRRPALHARPHRPGRRRHVAAGQAGGGAAARTVRRFG